jgi:hypothetical protein
VLLKQLAINPDDEALRKQVFVADITIYILTICRFEVVNIKPNGSTTKRMNNTTENILKIVIASVDSILP